jgi:hypothetical protein
MKAWFVYCNPDHEWGDLVHGETATDAKKEFWASWHVEAGDWLSLRPIRKPKFDNIPITTDSVRDAGWIANDEEWIPGCRCKICKDGDG